MDALSPKRTDVEQDHKALSDFIRSEWEQSVPDAVLVAAQDIADRYKGHVDGILFYGSCLRTGEYEDRILDFYVIVDDYHSAYGSALLAFGNAVVPPNVFYHEIDVEGSVVRSKYAVLSRQDLSFRTSTRCLNVSVWARFCQPAKLLLARDNETRNRIAGDLARAAVTMLGNAAPLLAPGASSKDLWTTAFSQTYRAELRSERGDKGLEIYLLDHERYDRLTPLIAAVLDLKADISKVQPPRGALMRAQSLWFLRRLNGKWVSFIRLLKASMTFDGGMDYLAWKIRRHSGVAVEIKPWMRRVPIVAGLYLFIKLRVQGAFR